MGRVRIGKWRRYSGWLQALTILGLPFLTVGGQSALRFDVPSLSLLFFGATISMDRFFIVLTVVLFIAFVFIALTMLFGRLWCGWACPQTVLSDFTGFIQRPGGYLKKALRYLGVFCLSALVGANILWYLVSPYEFASMLSSSNVVRTAWAVLSLIMFFNLAFVRRVFCATVCPYAKMQGVLFDDRTLLVAYDPMRQDECMGCRACARACPMGIDIRDGLQMACIGCAECIDACAGVREKKGKDTLVNYYWGGPARGLGRGGQRPRLLTSPLRVNVLIAIMGALAFGVLFAFTLMGQADLSATLRADPAFAPRMAGKADRAVNAYIITIANHTDRPAEYELSSPDAEILVRDVLRLPPQGRADIRVYASIGVGEGGRLPDNITIKLRQKGGEAIILNAPFRHPPDKADRGRGPGYGG